MILVSDLGVGCGKYSPLCLVPAELCPMQFSLFLKTGLQSKTALREGTESKCHRHMLQPHSGKVGLENKGDGEIIQSIKSRSI